MAVAALRLPPLVGTTQSMNKAVFPAAMLTALPSEAAARTTNKNGDVTMRLMLGAAFLLMAAEGLAEQPAVIPDAPSVIPDAPPGIPDAPSVKKADFGFAFLGALEFGGDSYATVFFTDGSTQDVKTGQGLVIGIGARYRSYPDAPFGLRSTIGYKTVTTKASNADIGIDRWVWDVMGNYRLNKDAWVGAGLVRHLNIKFDGDGFGPDSDFDDANGVKLELGWGWFALSFTDITYKDQAGDSYDAGSFGIIMTNAF